MIEIESGLCGGVGVRVRGCVGVGVWVCERERVREGEAREGGREGGRERERE